MREVRVGAVLLAAGRGSRFGAAEAASKLVAEIDGIPLVRRVAAAALASRAAPLVVVTGHAEAAIRAALAGLPALVVHNADHAAGLSTSLVVGIAALPDTATGALVLLGDMPLVTAATCDRLISRFAQAPAPPDAVIPVVDGRKGNPVLIGRSLFPALAGLRGDEGARQLLAAPGRAIALCEVDDAGIGIDVDTSEALEALRRS